MIPLLFFIFCGWVLMWHGSCKMPLCLKCCSLRSIQLRYVPSQKNGNIPISHWEKKWSQNGSPWIPPNQYVSTVTLLRKCILHLRNIMRVHCGPPNQYTSTLCTTETLRENIMGVYCAPPKTLRENIMGVHCAPPKTLRENIMEVHCEPPKHYARTSPSQYVVQHCIGCHR